MLVLVALLALVGCDNNPELTQPTPPPAPLAVSSATPAQVKITGALEVTSIKDGTTPVIASMTVLDGELALRDKAAWSGASGKVEVALGSFDSANPLRDDRVSTILLRAGLYPTAVFELTGVSGLPGEGIPVGGSGDGALAGQITLAGAAQAVQVPVTISRTADEVWTVATRGTVGLSLRGFGLQDQADALKTECAHASIDDVVRIGFVVTAAAAPPAPPAPEEPAPPPPAE